MPTKIPTEISIIEAARQLDVEPSYVYLLARAGRLEARKDGRQWLVSALGFDVEIELAPRMVLLRYDDVPGVIGRVGFATCFYCNKALYAGAGSNWA